MEKLKHKQTYSIMMKVCTLCNKRVSSLFRSKEKQSVLSTVQTVLSVTVIYSSYKRTVERKKTAK